LNHVEHGVNTLITNFMPHGHCYQWLPSLLAMQVISNSLIAIAYFLIPFALIYFIQKRKDMVFKLVFILFGVFIVSCGITHIMDIVVIWHPYYFLDSYIRILTAIASILTAIALVPLIPKAINLPSPSRLSKEIEERKLIEEALKKAHDELERRVAERTEELAKKMRNCVKKLLSIKKRNRL
jgi:hypothetical protein